MSRVAALALVLACVNVAPSASGSGTTYVTLGFDDNNISQYTLGYLQALQPHNAKAVFYVKSGSIGATSNITWNQLGTMAAGGIDVAGKTVSASNLTTDPNPTTQVCNDRAAIVSHNLTPVGFAYPGGANNATVQGIVKSCGYGNARQASGVSPGGAGETVPPANWYATKAYAPSAVTLANLQSLVTGIDTRGGGWAQIVIGRVCSQSLDPNNYTSCSAASGHIELADLNSFLDWMASAGQASGAPSGAQLKSLSQVVNAADSSAPTTTISCNGAACADTPYADVVSVTLSATDTGSGLSSTHYTTDGSDPTLSSPTYTGAFNVNSTSSSVTVKFRSWDIAGHVEAVNTQVIQAPPDSTAPTTTISCNNAACSASAYAESVTIKLSATDTGGSGVASTYYTTDGSTPTTSSTVYSGAFTLSTPGTTTVRYFSTDVAGNAEQAQSQQITVNPATTKVSLTFDNGALTQYTLGYLQALKPHGAAATFFVNSGTVGVGTNIMTWTQLQTLANAGNDIGGKSVNATNLTTDPNPTSQVCDDRTALLAHSLTPVAFAYPGGFSNATVKSIVKNCGYGSARSAGSLSPTGPTYAETLPPVDWFATRAYAPTSQMTLANMKALVTGASTHHGGWSQLVIGRVCSQAQDPNNYSVCTGTAGWVELDDLNSFLDWMGNAGQAGGAPAGAALTTVRDAAKGADTSTPTTAIACNGSACVSTAYSQTVFVTLTGTDSGSSVSSTHYTTDGTDPSLSSPTYSGRIPLTATTTIKFRSWDYAGNVEQVETQVIQVDQQADSTPPTTTISCDGSACSSSSYTGLVTVSLAATDAGWGVDKTYYTTDGSTPTTASTVYAGPFTVTSSTTVKFFSTDLAGNSEQPNAQALDVEPYKTTVALTFDDQYTGVYDYLRPMLRAHGMNITIYTITSDSEIPYQCCMSYAQLRTMQSEGDDVGGHGRNHLDLTDPSTTTAEKTEDVCGGRQDLIDHGISDPSSYAYPFGKVNASAEAIVQSCGFDTARQGGGLALVTTSPGPRYAEALPLKDPYALRAIDVDAPNPKVLTDMQAYVSAAAAHGGGLLTMTFHEVCDQSESDYASCMSSWSAADTGVLSQFLDWLAAAGQPGGAPAGVVVQTVRQAVMGADAEAPTTTLNCDGAACGTGAYSGRTSVSFPATDTGGSGVAATYYTTDGSTPTTSSPRFTAPFDVSQTTTFKFFSVDNAGNAEQVQSQTVIVQQQDTTAPTTTIACNALPCSGSYDASVQVTLAATDNTGGSGVAATYYTTDGSTPTTSSTVYTGAFTVSSTSTVKFFSTDNAGNAEQVQSQALTVQQPDTTAPTTTIQCNAAGCGTGWYSAAVQVALSATDTGGSGVASTYYTTDGSTPTTSSSVYSGPFSVSGTTTVKFFSVDAAGNSETVQSQLIQVDSTAPTTTIKCNAAGCGTGWYTAAVQVTLSATGGGSGVAGTYYTTDGSTPTTASTAYTGPFTVASTSTVKYFSVSTAGRAEAAGSQLIQVDGTPPTTTIRCNAKGCASKAYTAPVSVTFTAVDNAGGSGIASTHYTTDGSIPTLSSPTYTTAFTLTSNTTVRFRSWDVAGNIEATSSQTIQISGGATDQAPTASLLLTPTSGTAPVTVTADASGSKDTDATPIASYTFNFGDGSAAVTQTSPTATHTYTTAGTFTVTVTVTDTANLVGTATQKVTVKRR